MARKTKDIPGAKRAHRIQLVPTAAQERAFYGFAQVVRWTWNTALRAHNAQVADWKAAGEPGGPPTIASLKPRFNEGRPIFAAWTAQKGHRDCWSEPFVDLQKAFTAKREGRADHPRFKRFDDPPSFYVASDKMELIEKRFRVKGEHRVRLPKVGWVRMTEDLRFDDVKIRGARVTRDGAGRWFLSIQVAGVLELPKTTPKTCGTEVLGIDVGITNTITLSTGETLHAPRMSKTERKKMRRLQRSKSRKYEARKARRVVVKAAGGDVRTVKASKREQKARLAVGKLHAHIADRRNDWQHKTTTAIVKRSVAIGFETLSVRGMMRSGLRGMARSLADIGLGEIHRQLAYKAEGAKVEVHRWPKDYPSSQLCSSECGHRQKMPLGVQVYVCPRCGLVIHRDVNAALNCVPPARRVKRGTQATGNTEEQAATSVVQPVSVESVKSFGDAHVRT